MFVQPSVQPPQKLLQPNLCPGTAVNLQSILL